VGGASLPLLAVVGLLWWWSCGWGGCGGGGLGGSLPLSYMSLFLGFFLVFFLFLQVLRRFGGVSFGWSLLGDVLSLLLLGAWGGAFRGFS